MAESVKRATTIQEAQWACELVPLPEGDSRWVNLTQIRGTNVQKRLTRLLVKPESAKDTFSHITFAGHRGCGKSTELLQLSETLKPGKFLVINDIDAWQIESIEFLCKPSVALHG